MLLRCLLTFSHSYLIYIQSAHTLSNDTLSEMKVLVNDFKILIPILISLFQLFIVLLEFTHLILPFFIWIFEEPLLKLIGTHLLSALLSDLHVLDLVLTNFLSGLHGSSWALGFIIDSKSIFKVDDMSHFVFVHTVHRCWH